MERLAAQRRYAELHHDKAYHDGKFARWSEKASSATPFEASDGVSIYVAETDLNPADTFLTAPPMFEDREGGEQ